MKVVKILLGILGALGVGLVGLILACHFNPGLSDSIARILYRDKAEPAAVAEIDDSDIAEDTAPLPDSAGTSFSENPEELPEGEPLSQDAPAEETVVVSPVELKALEDYGLGQDNVLSSVQDYFDDCYEQLSAAKGETTSFYNVVRDSRLAEDVLRSYDDESYRTGFMNRFMDDYQVDTCGWSVEQEELQGGYVLVKHSFTR